MSQGPTAPPARREYPSVGPNGKGTAQRRDNSPQAIFATRSPRSKYGTGSKRGAPR